jgi:hypothetical protein
MSPPDRDLEKNQRSLYVRLSVRLESHVLLNITLLRREEKEKRVIISSNDTQLHQ